MLQERASSAVASRQENRTVATGFLAAVPATASLAQSVAHRDGRGPSSDKLVCAQPPHIGSRAKRADLTMHFGDVRVAPAESENELVAAQRLVRERYRWRGYDFDESGEDAPAEQADRGELTFLASNRESALGTLTLRVDGRCGLHAEATHRDVIEGVRTARGRLCELTRLAIADGANSRPVLAALFNLTYCAAATLHGVTDVLIEVNPRHVAFYSRILGFLPLTGETFCERVQAPSVLLHVEMGPLGERLLALARRALLPPVLARAA